MLTVEWTPAASRDLRRLERLTAQRVRQTVIDFAETGHGDRVRFTFADSGETLRVLRVRHRREAYR